MRKGIDEKQVFVPLGYSFINGELSVLKNGGMNTYEGQQGLRELLDEFHNLSEAESLLQTPYMGIFLFWAFMFKGQGDLQAQTTLWGHTTGDYAVLSQSSPKLITKTVYYGLTAKLTGCHENNNTCYSMAELDGTNCLPVKMYNSTSTSDNTVKIEGRDFSKISGTGVVTDSNLKLLSDQEFESFKYDVSSFSFYTERVKACSPSSTGGAGAYAVNNVDNYFKRSNLAFTIYYYLHRINTTLSPSVIGNAEGQLVLDAPEILNFIIQEGSYQWQFTACGIEQDFILISQGARLQLDLKELPAANWEISVSGGGLISQPVYYENGNDLLAGTGRSLRNADVAVFHDRPRGDYDRGKFANSKSIAVGLSDARCNTKTREVFYASTANGRSLHNADVEVSHSRLRGDYDRGICTGSHPTDRGLSDARTARCNTKIREVYYASAGTGRSLRNADVAVFHDRLGTGRSLRNVAFPAFHDRLRGDYDRGLCTGSNPTELGLSDARTARCNTKTREVFDACAGTGRSLRNADFAVFHDRPRGDYDRGLFTGSNPTELGLSDARTARCNTKIREVYYASAGTGRSLRNMDFPVFHDRPSGDYDQGLCTGSKPTDRGLSDARTARCNTKTREVFFASEVTGRSLRNVDFPAFQGRLRGDYDRGERLAFKNLPSTTAQSLQSSTY
ncbi:hypothetical protein [Persicobacter diffluens]|uniref:Uncharacterized protein n=1 Tax=Persicobacter diffluens TaxID=981 RepID=A0AAN4W0X4_9BACT|nr:hypothetical protein PEDI_36340 [Persicobacter diffluens]